LTRGIRAALLSVALAAAAFQVAPATAEAQCMMPSMLCSQVEPTPKAMIGLGLLGAEVGFLVPALVQKATRTNEWWPYAVFPPLGAVGGVIGGYVLEQATPHQPEPAVVILAIAMAAIVPTTVAVLALTAYEPGEGAGSSEGDAVEAPRYEDRTETDAIQVETGEGETREGEGERGGDGEGRNRGAESSALERRFDALMAGGPGVLRWDGRRLLLAAPILRRMPTFSRRETESLHLPPTSDIEIPIVSATF
jgi:hypothetical protein